MVLIWACLLLVSAGTVLGTSCDCSYKFYHGCKIINAAPAGFTCQCRYIGFWTCQGIPRKCDEDDYCPADCFSHECCIRGGKLAERNPVGFYPTNCDGVEF